MLCLFLFSAVMTETSFYTGPVVFNPVGDVFEFLLLSFDDFGIRKRGNYFAFQKIFMYSLAEEPLRSGRCESLIDGLLCFIDFRPSLLLWST